MDFTYLDKLSLLDFDERIACVLFASGCNFRCPFCHNGDLVTKATDKIRFEEIIAYLNKRKGILDAVVISGGEPTLMKDLKGKIAQIKELGYEVKLDTNGTNPEVVDELIRNRLIDYVAMDIKNSFSKYDITAGVKVNQSKIKETIKILETSGIQHEYRTTLVSEFHDENSIKEMGEFLNGVNCLFLQKFVDRETCIQRGLHEVNEETALKFKEILSKNIKSVELRGY